MSLSRSHVAPRSSLAPDRIQLTPRVLRYMINVKQIAKFVVALGERVAPTDIEEGMRVGVERNKYTIQIPLPPRIDPSVTMMQVCALARLYIFLCDLQERPMGIVSCTS